LFNIPTNALLVRHPVGLCKIAESLIEDRIAPKYLSEIAKLDQPIKEKAPAIGRGPPYFRGVR
jgi:hypothetical protein